MYEIYETVQKMIDYIEENIQESPTLHDISQHIGYSPYYCSAQFHKICKMTIRNYISGRRMALAAAELRNTGMRIIDIAVKYGFSSQEAFTRSFRAVFGCTPALYRKNPVPVPVPIRKVVYSPEHYHSIYKEDTAMSERVLTEAHKRIEYIPAHKYIGIWDSTASGYGEFWKNHDCDKVCGIIESMCDKTHLVVTAHTAGWHEVDGRRRYFYGFGVDEDYDGIVPEGFEIREFPASYYMVFFHPPFDYFKDNNSVMERVENLVWNYDLKNIERTYECEWNEEVCQCYQRHYPEVLGYEILRPIRIK